MCFIISEPDLAPKIAEKDIICYKCLKSAKRPNKIILKSPLINYTYKLKKLNKNVNLKINPPYNSYQGSYFFIDKGYHSYITETFYYVDTYICIIPKGSIYYQNLDINRYLSNQIVILCKKTWINNLITKFKIRFNIPLKYEKN